MINRSARSPLQHPQNGDLPDIGMQLDTRKCVGTMRAWFMDGFLGTTIEAGNRKCMRTMRQAS